MTLRAFVRLVAVFPVALALVPPGAVLADATRPNILFIILDDWSWRDSGAYGSTWVKTPTIDRVARGGVRFVNAFTSNPKCAPCRASILAGRHTWQLEEASVHNGKFPKKFVVYPDILEQAGYAIGCVGKGWGPGDLAASGRMRNPAGPGFNEFTTGDRVTSGISRNDYLRNFDAMMKSRRPGQPFGFWLGFFEPHRAYELNSGVRLGKKLDEVTVPPYLPDLQAVRSDLADYAVEVEATDGMISRVLQRLEETGEADNTLVVITSDHGMPFPYVKGQIFEDGIRLPVIMRWPKVIKPGRVVEDFVNVSDFAPTWLELAGLKPPPEMTGRSLARQLRSADSGWIEPGRDTMIVAKERHDIGRPNDWGYPVRGIRTKEYLYVLNYHPERWPAGNPETDFSDVDGGPSKEVIQVLGGYYYELSFGKRPAQALFHLGTDPATVNNLAGDPALAPLMKELRERMLAQLRAENDPRALGNGTIFDSYPYLGGRTNRWNTIEGYEIWLAQQEAKASAVVERAK